MGWRDPRIFLQKAGMKSNSFQLLFLVLSERFFKQNDLILKEVQRQDLFETGKTLHDISLLCMDFQKPVNNQPLSTAIHRPPNSPGHRAHSRYVAAVMQVNPRAAIENHPWLKQKSKVLDS